MQALLIKMEFLEQFCLAFKKKKILLDLSAKQITHMAKIMNDVYFLKNLFYAARNYGNNGKYSFACWNVGSWHKHSFASDMFRH